MPPSEFTTQSVADTHRQLLEALTGGPGILLVEGPSGCGKSHLKRRISESLADRFTLVDLPYSRLDPAQFATTLASGLSPGDPPAADPVTRIRKQLGSRARSGKPVLLLVDDAQFMPADTRAELSRLAAPSGDAPMYVLLFADPGANQRFALHSGADSDRGLLRRNALAPPSPTDMQRCLEAQPGHETLADVVREKILAEAGNSLRRLRQLLDLALLEQAHESQATENPHADGAERPSPRRQSRGQFAFGLVGSDDFPEPGPATQRALEEGNELDALTAAADSGEKAETAPGEAQANLPVLYRQETVAPAPSRRPALGLGLLAAAAVALVTVLAGAPLLRETPPQQVREASENGAQPLEQAALVAAPAAAAPASTAGPSPAEAPEALAAETAMAAPVTAPASATAEDGQPAPVSTPPAPAPAPSPPVPDAVATGAVTARAKASPAAATVKSHPEIDRLLDQARAHEAAYRLTLPSDNNAVRSYRQVLTLEPEHAQARAGLKRIQALYRDRAAEALEQENWEQARHNFERLLWIDSSDREAIQQLARLVRQGSY